MQNSGSESTRITASYCDCGLKNETLGAVQISDMSWQASSHNSNCIAALVKPHLFPLPFPLCAGVCVGVGTHKGQRSTSSVVPQTHLPCLLRQNLSVAPGLTIRPGWTVSEPWVPACCWLLLIFQAWASAPSFFLGCWGSISCLPSEHSID